MLLIHWYGQKMDIKVIIRYDGLLREVRSYGVELDGQDVIILGAGGAAKAVAYMCVSNGAGHVYILNRTVAKAQAIADHMN